METIRPLTSAIAHGPSSPVIRADHSSAGQLPAPEPLEPLARLLGSRRLATAKLALGHPSNPLIDGSGWGDLNRRTDAPVSHYLGGTAIRCLLAGQEVARTLPARLG